MATTVRQQALELDGVPPQHMVARIRRGVDVTIRQLRALEVITDADSAQVALARSLADMLDRELVNPDPSAYSVAQLSGKLQTALDRMREGMAVQPDTGLATFLESISTPQP